MFLISLRILTGPGPVSPPSAPPGTRAVTVAPPCSSDLRHRPPALRHPPLTTQSILLHGVDGLGSLLVAYLRPGGARTGRTGTRRTRLVTSLKTKSQALETLDKDKRLDSDPAALATPCCPEGFKRHKKAAGVCPQRGSRCSFISCPFKETDAGSSRGGGSGLSWKRRGCPPLPRPQRLHLEGPRKAGPERGLGEQGVLPEGGFGGRKSGEQRGSLTGEGGLCRSPRGTPGGALGFCLTAGESNPFFNLFLLATSDSRER